MQKPILVIFSNDKNKCFRETLNIYIDDRPAYTRAHCVLCARCCICLYILHSWLLLRFSYTFNFFYHWIRLL